VSTVLNWVNLRIINNTECLGMYGASIVIGSVACARGWTNGTQNVCQGDSGGPMIINEHGVWTQIGIVSFVSSRGCGLGDPSGFTRTASHLYWIAQETGVGLRP
jgi:secreted trypsin-like serine protease